MGLSPEKVKVAWEEGQVSGLWQKGVNPFAVMVLAHGAGAGYNHPFLEDLSDGLAEKGMSTLRFQFPYMEAGKRRVDSKNKCLQVLWAAEQKLAELAPGMPYFFGGKSFGGRMASHGCAENKISPRGLIFYGFPLHPPKKPGSDRADHLMEIDVPMLFLQGERDALATPELLTEVNAKLGALSHLVFFEDGDHSFKVRKRSGLDQGEVFSRLQEETVGFCRQVLGL